MTGQEKTPDMQSNQEIVAALFAKLDPTALALGAGGASAVLVLLATLALVIQGAPEGQPVGTNLSIIAQYFPGFQVSVLGSLGGAFYGFIIGGAMGFLVAGFWNLTHILVAGFAVLKNDWLE